MTTGPFAPGSISLGTYVHNDRPPSAMVDALIAQAVLADESGFDGVTLAEHHGGYPTYVPNPILAASWLLDAMPAAWSGPNPILLPLRTPGPVLEDLAWLAARYPGRVGATFASGYVEHDFILCDASFAGRHDRFRAALRHIGRELREPTELFAGDAVVCAAAQARIPLVVAAKGARAIALAAELGMGVSVPATDPAELRDLHDVYAAAGGASTRMMMRWVWVGDLPEPALRRWEEEHQYSIDDGTVRADKSSLHVVTARDPADVAEQLATELAQSRSTALSVRIHMPDVPIEAVNEQIVVIGSEVLPLLRRMLPSV